MNPVSLKVATEDIYRISNEIRDLLKDIELEFQNIRQEVQKSRAFWEGEAENRHMKNIFPIEKLFLDAIRRLKEHPVQLQQMAGIYEEAERTAVDDAEGLQTNLIV